MTVDSMSMLNVMKFVNHFILLNGKGTGKCGCSQTNFRHQKLCCW
jgi:hypothetical protein